MRKSNLRVLSLAMATAMTVSLVPANDIAVKADETTSVVQETDESALEQCEKPTPNLQYLKYTMEGFLQSGYISANGRQEGSTYYYTLDGTEPSATNGNRLRSLQYTTISQAANDEGVATLKVISVKEGLKDSEVATYTFRIAPDTVAIFNDEVLKTIVMKELGIEGDKTTAITKDDLLQLKELKAENAGITDLTGLEYATNIEVIDLAGNDLSGTGGASALETYGRNLYKNGKISSLPELRIVNLAGCHICEKKKGITANDIGWAISRFFNSPKLESMDLSDNQMRGNIEFYPQVRLENFKILNLSDNDLNGANYGSKVSYLPALEKFDLSKNRVCPIEDTGEWYKNAVSLGLDKFDFSDQKSLTELIDASVDVKGATVTVDNEKNEIIVSDVMEDTLNLTIKGYGEERTMSWLTEGMEVPAMAGTPTAGGTKGEFSLIEGENSFPVNLTHVGGETRTYTLKVTRKALPTSESEDSAGIKDIQLQKAVCTKLKQDATTYVVTKADMESLNGSLSVSGVKDFAGLEYAVNLTGLTLNNLGEVEVDVSTLTNLTTLWLTGSATAVKGLKNLTNLKNLYLTGSFSELPGVETLEKLTILRVDGNLDTAPDLTKATSLTSVEYRLAKDKTLPKSDTIKGITLQGCQDGVDWNVLENAGYTQVTLNDCVGEVKLPSTAQKITVKAKENETVLVDISTIKTEGATLSLSGSGYFEIKGENEYLQTLNISDAKGITVAEECKAEGVTKVDISGGGEVFSLPEENPFPNITELKIWYGYALQKWPVCVNDMLKLTSLQINYGGLKTLKGLDLSKCENLSSVSISSHKSAIKETLDGSQFPASVTKLSLALSGITGLTGTWKTENMDNLDVSWNAMKEFPTDTVKQMTKLQTLWLQGNAYLTIPEDAFEKNTALKTVYLGDWFPVVKSGIYTYDAAPGTAVEKAIAKLKEVASGVNVSISAGPSIFTMNNNYSALTGMEVSAGTLEGDVFTERNLSLTVPEGTDAITLTPTALLPDTMITVNGKDYKSGDEIKVELTEMVTNLTITTKTDFINDLELPQESVYAMNIIVGKYMENFVPEEGHYYTIDYVLRKADGSNSMANDYFDGKATVKYADGKYEIRFTTGSADMISDMKYADGQYADIVNKDGSNCTYRIYADAIDKPITITPQVAPMGNVYVSCYMSLDLTKAIDITSSVSADKTDLNAAISKAEQIIDKRNIYTTDSWKELNETLETARELSEREKAQQSLIDKAAQALSDAIDALEIDESKLADTTELKDALDTAGNLEKGNHTDTAWEALQDAIADAQEVLDDQTATQKEVDAATKALNNTVKLFNTSGEASTLDAANLADGTYTAQITMLNASNPSQNSMSDGAVTKPITITVKDGAYTATVNFHGLNINLAGVSFYGYLKELSYWNGKAYTPVTVDSTYDIVDDFNDADKDGVADYAYPKQMSFPLVNKNLGDDENGNVHVQVFVPIMESLSAGTGTQQALMKVDWSTLKAVATEEPTEPTTEPVVEPTTEPLAETTTDQAGETTTEPAAETTTEPVVETTTEPATEEPTEPATEEPTEPGTEPVTEPADNVALKAALEEAESIEQGNHTDAAWAALQEAIADAREILSDAKASQREIDIAQKALANAVTLFNTSETTGLDAANLADGTYSAQITMINASNPAQKSMSDGAVTKPIKITVKDGAYFSTVNFHGLNINLAGQSFYGYLKELSYWDGTAYQPVTVESIHDVVDAFNDANEDGVADYNYPNQMTFPLVNKNAGDDENGYVRVQVFVPIMESLAAGTGTQQALMAIDWTSLEVVNEEEPVTTPETTEPEVTVPTTAPVTTAPETTAPTTTAPVTTAPATTAPTTTAPVTTAPATTTPVTTAPVTTVPATTVPVTTAPVTTAETTTAPAATTDVAPTTAAETTTETPAATTATEPTTAPETTVAPTTTQEVKVGKAKVKTATKKKADKKMKVTLKKVQRAQGYQVAVYKTKKNAKKNKSALVKKFVTKTMVNLKAKKLKNQKALFVRARAYVLVNGEKKYGTWSKMKRAKIK